MSYLESYKAEREQREKTHRKQIGKLPEYPGPEFTLTRKWFTDKSTIGVLTMNGDFLCHTLEDTVRDPNKDGIFTKDEKIYGETAIPAGRYEVVINFSNKFKRYLPLLLNVPYYKGIRFHSGNRASDTSGCIIPGVYDGTGSDFVSNSRATLSRIQPQIEALLKTTKLFLNVIGGPRYEDNSETA